MCMILSVIAFGQNQRPKLLEEVEVIPPAFTGIKGVVTIIQEEEFESIEDYLSKNVQYPEESGEFLFEGTEVVQFVVTSSGEVTNFKVINSVSSEIDDEVIRVLKTTNGMWKPGSNNGKPVAMEKEVSIIFKIDETKERAETKDLAKIVERFYRKGSKNLLIKNKPKRALKYYDKGIVLLPNEKSLLLVRGLARFELGNQEGACRDWNRIKTLGGFESDPYLDNFCEMKGYAELIRMLEE